MVGWRASEYEARRRFSALQRAEIAEMRNGWGVRLTICRFSALQRAEIAEIVYRLVIK